MTSRSARHTSSTVPTRCCNATPSAITNGAQWRAPGSRWSKVHSTHTTRRVRALTRRLRNSHAVTFHPGRAILGAQPWDSGYPCEQRLTEGRLDPLRPSRTRDLRRALARRLRSLHYDPQLPFDSAGRPSPPATAVQMRAPCASDERMDKDLRLPARASCAGKETFKHGRARVRPETGLRPPAQPLCAQKEFCDRERAHGAPWKEFANMSAATPRSNENCRHPYSATTKAHTERYDNLAFNDRCGAGVTRATKAHPLRAPTAAHGDLWRGLMAREWRRANSAPWTRLHTADER